MDTMLTGEINHTDNIERAEKLEIWKSRPLELGVYTVFFDVKGYIDIPVVEISRLGCIHPKAQISRIFHIK